MNLVLTSFSPFIIDLSTTKGYKLFNFICCNRVIPVCILLDFQRMFFDILFAQRHIQCSKSY